MFYTLQNLFTRPQEMNAALIASHTSRSRLSGSNGNIFMMILLAICILPSCVKTDIDFGTQYLATNNTQIIKTDSFTTNLSTIYIDSFITSNTSAGVIGAYQDPVFGQISASTYLQIAPASFADTFSNTVFESLELIIHLNKSYYGDTTQPVTIAVHQLKENIEQHSASAALYNTDSFLYNEDPIGVKTTTIRPSVDDSISINLEDALGTTWLSMLQQGDEQIKSLLKFNDYFKGIYVTAVNKNGMVFGCKDSITLRLHYKKKDLFLRDGFVDFSLYERSFQFNHITIDRTGTAIESLSKKNNEIPAATTNNIAYLQAITGSAVKISFPSIRNVLELPGFVKIISAELRVQPVPGSFDSYKYMLPPLLRLSTTDALNKIGTDITKVVTSGTTSTQTGDLQIDDLYGIYTYYSYDITSYIKSQIAISSFNKNGLIISPPSYNFQTTFNRILLGEANHKTSNVTLVVYYLAVNQ